MADPDATPGAERPPAKPEQQNVGSAYTQPDGTLEMSLRTETDDGTNGEAFLIIPPDDPRYPSMVAHLGDLQPGQGRAIGTTIDGLRLNLRRLGRSINDSWWRREGARRPARHLVK